MGHRMVIEDEGEKREREALSSGDSEIASLLIFDRFNRLERERRGNSV